MFNIKNSNTEFLLFFGEELGLTDSFNLTYPEILESDQKQRELFWSADEIDLSKDAQDLLEVDENIYELMIRALSFQLAGDSFANGSIAMLFLPIVSNPQAKGLVSYWNDTESVHDRAYSRIVAQCFKDPNALLDRVRQDQELINRLTPLLKNFSVHMDMVYKWVNTGSVNSEDRKTCIRTLITLLGLEGIMFLSSFATTFALCESTNSFNGIAKLVGLIHDDEGGSHVKNGLSFLNIIINKERWTEWIEVKEDAKFILDEIITTEEQWAEKLFDGCGSVVGFNSKLLKQYTKYLAKPLYDKLGLQWDFEVIDNNPFPWIKSYTSPDLLQVANQEAQNGNYKVSASIDDTSEMEFEFD